MSASALVSPSRRVPVEFIGRARAIRAKLIEGDEYYATEIAKIVSPLIARRQRYPRRQQRPQDLIDIARAIAKLDVNRVRWYFDAPAKRQLVISDYRASSSDWMDERWDDPRWQGGIAVTKFTLSVTDHIEAGSVVICNIALHGLARFLERSPRTDMISLREELAPLITSEARFHVPTPLGFWYGAVIAARDKEGKRFPSRSVRTWVSEEMLE